MSKLEELRARLRKENKSTTTFENKSYQFWNMPTGKSATIRFLPDKNENNPFFWAERQIIKIPFPGIKGQDENKEVIVQVPCNEMYGRGHECPIHKEIRPWWDMKDPEMEKLAKTYWKKRSYIYQGFVRSNPLSDDTYDANTVRVLYLSPQIHNIIKESLLDEEILQNDPCSYTEGTDFRIKKTKSGEHASYNTSAWARNDSPLTSEELEVVNNVENLNDLESLRPKQPDEEHLDVIYDMFKASLDGELYDPKKWSKYYRPWGLKDESTEQNGNGNGNGSHGGYKAPDTINDNVTESKTSEIEAEADDDVPFEPDPVAETSTGKSVDDILAMVRNSV